MENFDEQLVIHQNFSKPLSLNDSPLKPTINLFTCQTFMNDLLIKDFPRQIFALHDMPT